MSAIFVSHSSRDNEAAQAVTGWLSAHGHRSIFLDFDPEYGIPAGRDWEQEIYRKIRACRAVVVICSRNSMESRWCFMEITHARALGKHIFPIRIDDCEIDGVLADHQIIDLRVEQFAAFALLERGLEAAGLDPADVFDWDGSRSPYPGLLAFQEVDAAIFFGRDREIGEGLDLLGRVRRLGEPVLVMILGASGAGKSSLVRAGLIPRLRRDPDRWIVAPPFRPQRDAVRELAAAVSRTYADLGHDRDRIEIESLLRGGIEDAGASASLAGDNVLVDLADDIRLTTGRDDARVLFTVDQFEELLGQPHAHPSTGLLAVLRGAATRVHTPLIVLGTMRSDYLGAFQQHPSLVGLETRSLSLGPMAIAKIAQVIAKPADLAGLDLEDGLVQQMTADAETDDALPLLAFALRRLYEGYAADDVLSLSDYRDGLGGLQGAIATVADELVDSKRLSAEQEAELRRSFLAMVRIRDDGTYARQSASWDTMPLGSRELLESFVKARLLVASGDGQQRTIEVAHEALFRSWDRLRSWLDENQKTLVLHRDLERAASRWDEADRSVDHLWRGGRLQLSRELLASGDLVVDDVTSSFVDESERSEQAEVELARTRRRRIWLAAFGVLVLFAIGATAFAIVTTRQSSEANRQRDRALVAEAEAEAAAADASARALAASAEAAQARDPGLAALLALEADRVSATPETMRAMHGVVTSAWQRTLPGGESTTSAAISGDGTKAVVAGTDGVVVWDLEGNAPPLKLTDERVSSVSISRDGSRVLTNGGYIDYELAGPVISPGDLKLWDLDSGQTSSLTTTQGPRSVASLSPDGRRVLTIDEGVQVWDTDGDASPTILADEFADHAAFDSDASRVVTVGFDGLIVWDLDRSDSPRGVTSERVTSAAFSHDGTRLVTTSGSLTVDDSGIVGASAGDVAVWDIGTGERTMLTTGEVASARFSPDDTRIITAGTNGAMIWSVDGTSAPLTLTTDIVTVAEFTRDGSQAFTLGADGGATVWSFELGEPILAVTDTPTSSASFAPNGTQVLTTDAFDGAVVWDLEGARSRTVVTRGSVRTAEFDPRGEQVLTATDFLSSGTPDDQAGAAIWDVRGGGTPEVVTPRTAFTAAYSADGRRIVTTGDYSVFEPEGVVVWDLAGEDDPLTVTADRVVAAVFDRSGTRVVTAGESGATSWDIGGNEPARIVTGSRTSSAEFDPAGEHVLTIGEAGVVLWPLDDGSAAITFTTEEADSATFNRDGNMIVTAGDDGVLLWDTSGQQLAQITSDAARTATFDPDGGRIVAAGESGVHIWRVRTAEELRADLTRRLDGLVLTPSECTAYRIDSCQTG